MRFAFDTFRVDGANEQALSLCQSIAQLKPVAPLPAILVGEAGCGKTHLLYSIVNHVRASSRKTALAFVTATKFPTEVRQLVDNPAPIAKADSAILLVDQLDGFQERAHDLEAVVRLFLSHGHRVVMASRVLPGELVDIPQRLRSLLEAGQVARIGAIKEPEQSPQPLLGDMVRQYQEETHRLREELLVAKENADVAQHQAALAETKAFEQAQLLEKAQREREEALELERAEAMQAVALAKEEAIRKAALEKAEALKKAETEKRDLQSELDRARQNMDSLAQQLRAEEGARASLEHYLQVVSNEAASLKLELETVRVEAESTRARLESAGEDQAQLEQYRALLSENAQEKAAMGDKINALQQALDQATTENEDTAHRLQQLLNMLEQGQAEYNETQVAQRQAMASLQETVDVATAHAKLGDLEREHARLSTAHDTTQAGLSVTEEMQRLGKQLSDAACAVSAIAARLAATADGCGKPESSKEEDDQAARSDEGDERTVEHVSVYRDRNQVA